jgi:uncharacterized protein
MTLMPFASLTTMVVVAVAMSVTDVPNPRPRGAWVSDSESIIPADAEARINARLEALNRDLGVEIAVVTVSNIGTTPKEFATLLFQHWGVGKRGVDNGLLVLLVRDQRRLEMETGYGLESRLPDGWLGVMQYEVMAPAFRNGDYAAGLEAGIERIDQRLRTAPDQLSADHLSAGARREPQIEPALAAPASASSWLADWGPATGVAFAAGLWIFFVLRARKRERTCSKCRVRMRMLDEIADDAHLSDGQKREEALGSVDYRVYICPQCQGSRVVAKTACFSGYARCGACHFETLVRESITLVEATYTQGGEVRVTETCQHCPHTRTFIRETPQLTPPPTTTSSYSSSSSFSGSSSSSSGSSGSFGGGRSGGGGAGSSW